MRILLLLAFLLGCAGKEEPIAYNAMAIGLDAQASESGNLGIGKDVFACILIKDDVKCVEIPPGEYTRMDDISIGPPRPIGGDVAISGDWKTDGDKASKQAESEATGEK